MLTTSTQSSKASSNIGATAGSPTPSAAPSVFPDDGLGLLHIELPTEVEAWPKFSTRALVDASGDDYDLSREEVQTYARGKPWAWPSQTLYFLCDQHADTDAFLASLVGTGGVAKTGAADADLELTERGRGARFVIGGDLVDKGPANLRLLRALHALLTHCDRTAGASLELLAGNHDLRLLVGLVEGGRRDPLHEHLFVRLGQKSVPLFKEVFDEYLAGGDTLACPTDDEVHERLFPRESWFTEFPQVARGRVPLAKIEREVKRIRQKVNELEARCQRAGLTLGQMAAAYDRCRQLFLEPEGDFAWFFRRMKLAHREGSFLFLHAGVDDDVASLIRREGVDALNAEYERLRDHDLFELYHGAIGNTFRTKYRKDDRPLTPAGVAELHRAGIYAIVHGHQSLPRGQRVRLRSGLLNFECDASVDCNTRAQSRLLKKGRSAQQGTRRAKSGAAAPSGAGAACVAFLPDGRLFARSTDYPYAKLFDAAELLDVSCTF